MMMKIAACLAAACALAGRPRRRSSVGTKRRPTTKAPLVAPPTFVAATICHFFAIFYYVLPEVPLSPHVDSLGVLVGPAPYATAARLPGQA